ncbi:kinase-like protein [Athelia psychrophila]|uniref:non-specific serine/threonine protein kinase n=1 Tax=Athelia psychrophila TaxID=1759441 RepID=A0A167WBL9_9AGAM|nr:kinase-like protein [Fibularhizoctonia sp. CBS 109695]
MPGDDALPKSSTAPMVPTFENEVEQNARSNSNSTSESIRCESSCCNLGLSDGHCSGRSSLTSNESNDGKQFTLENRGITYTIHGVIARGGFGEVLQAESSLGDQVAIKVCAKEVEGSHPQRVLDVITTELWALSLTTDKRQPFLTQALASFEDNNNVYFVMRLYATDLYSIIQEGIKFNKMQFKVLACELLLGLEELHKLHFVHRDLKPRNILLTPEGHLAVADFGLGEWFLHKLDAHSHMHDTVGTTGYHAPEVLGKYAYDHRVDMWGFGIILFELYTGKDCITGNTKDEIRHKTKWAPMTIQDTITAEIDDPALVELLMYAMSGYPHLRPSWEEFRTFTFFDDVDWEAIKSRSSPVDMFKPDMAPVAPRSSYSNDDVKAVDEDTFPELDHFELRDDLRCDNQHGRAAL